jgi:hypothetical protein
MTTPTSAPPGAGYEYQEEREGYGWLIFAGTMLAIVGTLNFIYGIAAVSNSKFFIHDQKYVIANLHTWGWFMIIIGALQFFAAFSIWGGTSWGRWIGIPTAAVNAIVQLLSIPSYPLLSLALFTVDILILYGLIAYGGRQTT